MAWGYYAYIIDDNGHVQNRIEVLCEQLVDGHAIELWQEARRVATFQPKQKYAELAAAFILDSRGT